MRAFYPALGEMELSAEFEHTTEGVRDLVMELCCALHNFRVRLTPWQSMI